MSIQQGRPIRINCDDPNFKDKIQGIEDAYIYRFRDKETDTHLYIGDSAEHCHRPLAHMRNNEIYTKDDSYVEILRASPEDDERRLDEARHIETYDPMYNRCAGGGGRKKNRS